MNNEQLTPRITPELITRYPDQLSHVLNRFIEDFYDGNGGGCECTGNLDSIIQTTTSYDDGGVNIITAYLSDGTTSEFQIRNGKKGSQGDPGPAGQDGADGAPGADGFSPIATVTKSGDTATISITDANGTTTATVTDGADGAAGQAATIAVGSTSTLPEGSSATVTNSGTSSAAVFDFGIPKGDKGDTGATGPANTLSIGTVVSGATADATITGTAPNQTLNLVLPKGDPGTPANVVNSYSTSTTDAYSASYVNGVIPTVNDATLTIQKNGTDVGTFTANASSNVTANITVPTQTSDITNNGSDGTSTYVEADDLATVATSGDYGDLLNKPTIPTVNDATLTIEQNGVTAGTFTANSSSDTTVSLTDTTYSNFVGTDGVNAGSAGLVPAPTTSDGSKYLKGDGTWADTPPIELVEMVYGESNAWQKFIDAYNNKCIVYCRASSNANPASGAKTRKAFMAYVNNETTPTQVEFQYVRSISSHSDTQQGDQVFVYLLKNTSGGTWSVSTREMSTRIVAGTNMTSSYASGTLTLNADQPTVNDAMLTIEQNGVTAGTFTANASSNATISLTDTTYSDFTGATSSIAGSAGLVPAPAAGDDSKFLAGDGTWQTVSSGGSDTGWLDCTYKTGYQTSSNTGWLKLQARVINGILYMRGGVSPSSGTFTINSEYNVATLPSTITSMLTTTSALNSAGRASSSAISLWTVMSSGEIYIICDAGLNGGTGGRAWASAPGCLGTVD